MTDNLYILYFGMGKISLKYEKLSKVSQKTFCCATYIHIKNKMNSNKIYQCFLH